MHISRLPADAVRSQIHRTDTPLPSIWTNVSPRVQLISSFRADPQKSPPRTKHRSEHINWLHSTLLRKQTRNPCSPRPHHHTPPSRNHVPSSTPPKPNKRKTQPNQTLRPDNNRRTTINVVLKHEQTEILARRENSRKRAIFCQPWVGVVDQTQAQVC